MSDLGSLCWVILDSLMVFVGHLGPKARFSPTASGCQTLGRLRGDAPNRVVGGPICARPISWLTAGRRRQRPLNTRYTEPSVEELWRRAYVSVSPSPRGPHLLTPHATHKDRGAPWRMVARVGAQSGWRRLDRLLRRPLRTPQSSFSGRATVAGTPDGDVSGGGWEGKGKGEGVLAAG